MADVTKEKVISINTGKAEKNVKSLKTQIRELKEQMSQLEKGTAEYDKVSKQLADTNQKQIEINEAMKYSNKDLGATLSNLTTVSAGVVGSISAINGVMNLMGVEGEEAQKAMMKIQSLMAIVQGLSAIDKAIKAVKGLTVAFKSFNSTRLVTSGSTATATAAEALETKTLADNTAATEANIQMAKSYDTAQQSNIEYTNISTEAILRETEALRAAEFQQKVYASSLKNWGFYKERANKALAEGAITEEEYAKKMAHMATNIQKQKDRLEEATAAYQRFKQAKNEDSIGNTTNTTTENANTAAINANTSAKAKNTGATATNTVSQKAGTAATAASIPVTNAATKGVKGLTTAFKGLSKALPWLIAISVGISLITSMFRKASEEEEKMKQRLQDYQDMLNNINKTIEEGKVHVDVLLERLNSSKSLNEKKLIIDELNKEIPNFNGKVDETTKAVTYSEEALKKYNKALEARTKLKAYEAQLADLKAQRAEYELMMRIAQHSPMRKKEWEEAKANLKQVEAQIFDIERLIKEIDLGAALSLDKKGNGGGAKTVVRTVKEMLVDIKALYKEIIGDMTAMADTKNMFDGVYSSLDSLRNKIYGLVSTSIGTKAGEAFTESFASSINNGLEDFDFYGMTVDKVFNREMVDRLTQDLVAEEQTLAKYLNKQVKVSETVIKKQKEKVAALTTEVNTIKDVLNAVIALGEEERKQALKAKEIKKWNIQYEQTKNLQEELMADIRSNNPYKEINQSISKATYSLENFKNELSELDEEENRLNSLGVNNKQITDRLEEIAKRRREIALEQYKLESELEETMHQKRMLDLNEEHDGVLANVEKEYNAKLWQQEEHDLNYGQTDNYNTAVREVENTVKMLEAQMSAVEEYYDTLMVQFDENSVEWINLEIEKNATLEELDRQHMEKSVELEQEKSKRRLTIAKTYISAYSALSNQIGSILSAEMERYDENTKEYKNMKYAQGVINTGEGVLAAFMSGIDSGLLPPWNLVLATAMAGLTLTAGIMQLNNIKNEKLGGSMPNSVNIGSEYDTLSFSQNADILSSIRDQRCYVLESDISDTQRRVQVQESSATF